MARSKKKSKKDKKNLKGWASGWRADFLKSKEPQYTDACDKGRVAEQECLRGIYKEYFYYCHWSLADDEEPTLPEMSYDPSNLPLEILSESDQARRKECRDSLKPVCVVFDCIMEADTLLEADSPLAALPLPESYATTVEHASKHAR